MACKIIYKGKALPEEEAKIELNNDVVDDLNEQAVGKSIINSALLTDEEINQQITDLNKFKTVIENNYFKLEDNISVSSLVINKHIKNAPASLGKVKIDSKWRTKEEAKKQVEENLKQRKLFSKLKRNFGITEEQLNLIENVSADKAISSAEDLINAIESKLLSLNSLVLNSKKSKSATLQQKEQAKTIEQLFNENPELANAVYEAAGFKITHVDLTPSELTSKPIGSPLDQSEGTGICDGTCGLMAGRLQQAGMPYGYAEIEDKVANYHAVALTEIDGERYILNQPQHEFLSIEYQKAPLWERAMFWRGMSQRFNRHLPRILNDLYFSEGINPYPALFGKIKSEYFGEVGPIFKDKKIIKREGYSVVTGTLIENPSVRIAIKLEEGQTLETIDPEEADVQTTKNGEKVPIWVKTEFTPRFIKVTKENLIKEYQLTNKQADISIKAINEAIINPGTKTQITPQQKQQAQQLYSQYLDSLNKSNTNPILQNNQQEQIKKFAELQERLNNKEFIEGAKNVYESTPALQQLSTQEEYNDYIARVSLGIIKNPSSGRYNYTSKVKDIVYRSQAEKGDESRIHRGTYFSIDKKYSEVYGKTYKVPTKEFLINLKNPKDLFVPHKKSIRYDENIVNGKNLDFQNLSKEDIDLLKNNNYDSVVVTEEKFEELGIKETIGKEIIVFEPEQIHILGGKNDIEGFKQFVQGKQFQKLTAEEKAKTIEQATKEHRSITALKDLSAKLAHRIGGTIQFENKTDVDWKGYNQGMKSVLNEAYMDESTAFHEIMGHPIIRALKSISSQKESVTLQQMIDNQEIEKKCS